jgi:hypothetical protein
MSPLVLIARRHRRLEHWRPSSGGPMTIIRCTPKTDFSRISAIGRFCCSAARSRCLGPSDKMPLGLRGMAKADIRPNGEVGYTVHRRLYEIYAPEGFQVPSPGRPNRLQVAQVRP